jgi:hypothetical protein
MDKLEKIHINGCYMYCPNPPDLIDDWVGNYIIEVFNNNHWIKVVCPKPCFLSLWDNGIEDENEYPNQPCSNFYIAMRKYPNLCISCYGFCIRKHKLFGKLKKTEDSRMMDTFGVKTYDLDNK